ncbi:redoxin domain-containing protein, partial [Vibrio parahaemolyticus]
AWADASPAIAKVKYPMLGDGTGKITRGFNVMIEEDNAALRGTFLVDPDGKIKVAEIHDLGIGRSAKDLIRKIEAAQYVR